MEGYVMLKVMLMGQQLSIVNLQLVSAGCWIHQRLFQNYFTKRYNQLIQQKKNTQFHVTLVKIKLNSTNMENSI